MKNLVQDGDILQVTAPYARSSGDFVQVGLAGATSTTHQLGGICMTDVGNGAAGQVKLTGVFDITALGTDTGSVFAPVYWDNTNKYCTVTATGNLWIGTLLAAKTNGPTTMRVKLHGILPMPKLPPSLSAGY